MKMKFDIQGKDISSKKLKDIIKEFEEERAKEIQEAYMQN